MIRILLDIDGTILPGQTIPPTARTTILPEKLYNLTFYAAVVEKLAAFSELENCEIVMCTSWDESSLEIAQALHIKTSRYLSFWQDDPKVWYKWASICQFCKEHPKDNIVLCDDLASPAATRHKPKNLVKIIQPNPAFGLNLKNLEELEKILRKDQKKLKKLRKS